MQSCGYLFFCNAKVKVKNPCRLTVLALKLCNGIRIIKKKKSASSSRLFCFCLVSVLGQPGDWMPIYQTLNRDISWKGWISRLKRYEANIWIRSPLDLISAPLSPCFSGCESQRLVNFPFRSMHCATRFVFRTLQGPPTLLSWTAWPCIPTWSSTLGLQVLRERPGLPSICADLLLGGRCFFFLIKLNNFPAENRILSGGFKVIGIKYQQLWQNYWSTRLCCSRWEIGPA